MSPSNFHRAGRLPRQNHGLTVFTHASSCGCQSGDRRWADPIGTTRSSPCEAIHAPLVLHHALRRPVRPNQGIAHSPASRSGLLEPTSSSPEPKQLHPASPTQIPVNPHRQPKRGGPSRNSNVPYLGKDVLRSLTGGDGKTCELELTSQRR